MTYLAASIAPLLGSRWVEKPYSRRIVTTDTQPVERPIGGGFGFIAPCVISMNNQVACAMNNQVSCAITGSPILDGPLRVNSPSVEMACWLLE